MPGAQLAIKIQAASRVAINILTNNFFDKRPCDLVLKSGKEQDVSTLNSIGLSLVRVGVPVTGIIANYAQVINGYQQLSTQQMRSSIGAPSGRYQTHIPTISNLEVIGLLVSPQSTQKTLSDKIIEDELDYKGPLEAIRCTFKEPIYVKSGQFKEVVALENVNCQESLKAEKSTFERTVQVEKGDLEFIDTKASKLIAKDKIKIENGDFKTAKSDQIKVTGSTSRRIDANSQVEMINSKTQYVELTLKETALQNLCKLDQIYYLIKFSKLD